MRIVFRYPGVTNAPLVAGYCAIDSNRYNRQGGLLRAAERAPEWDDYSWRKWLDKADAHPYSEVCRYYQRAENSPDAVRPGNRDNDQGHWSGRGGRKTPVLPR
jgi:hypothetical protein